MKTKLLPLLVIAAGISVPGLRAQTEQPAPALAVDVRNTAPQPSQLVYAPGLPSVDELKGVASAQGATIEKIIQSPTQVIVTYRAANGAQNTVSYMLLSAATASAATAPVAPPQAGTAVPAAPAAPATATSATPGVVVGTTTPTVVTMASPSPQVVYVPSSPAPYYYDPFYYPYYGYGYPWYAPVSVSFGFGYYYGGHYHGDGGHYHGGGGHGGHGGHH